MAIDITNKEEKQIALTGAEIESALLQAHLSKDAIEKIEGLKASASEIDAACFLKNNNLVDIHKFFINSFYSTDVNVYVSSGDSTSAMGESRIQDNYTYILKQINMTYYDNSYSGQTAYDWLNNVDNNTLQKAINNSLGVDGANTIMEFSLGINDYNGINTEEDIYNLLYSCITSYQTAKPKATIFLSSTIRTSSTVRDTLLLRVYDRLGEDLRLFHFKRYTSTDKLWNNPLYYFDYLHPNRFGARAWMCDLFNTIIPMNLSRLIELEPFYSDIEADTSHYVPMKILRGYFSILSGTYGNYIFDRNALCIDKFAVNGGESLIVSHVGNRRDIFFYDVNGAYLSRISQPTFENYTYTFIVPANARFVSLNITLKFSDFIGTGCFPIVHKPTSDDNIYLSLEQTLWTVNNSFKLNNKRFGQIIDDYGNVGESGQTLSCDVNFKMKWA